MKKIFILLAFVFSASSGFSQGYGVVFIPGLGGSPDEFKSGYDHTRLVNDLKSTLNITDADIVYINHNLANGVKTNLSVDDRAAQVATIMRTQNLTKEWFLIGYSTGGVVAKLFNDQQPYNSTKFTVQNLKIKGVVTIASPMGGMNNLKGGLAAAKAKWASYYAQLRTGPDGFNPIIGDDETWWGWMANVALMDKYLSLMNTGIINGLEGYFDNSREDIKSLQKNSGGSYSPGSSFSNANKNRFIGGEDFKYATLRAGGSLPSYLTAGSVNLIENSGFYLSAPGAVNIMSLFEGMENFSDDFYKGPLNAVGNIEAVKSYFHYKRNKYNDRANYYNQWFFFGSHSGTVANARAARDRYAVSRDAVDKLDWVSQDVSNDLKYTYETIVVTHKEIDEAWLEKCGDIYYGNPTPEPEVGFSLYDYDRLPSLLSADVCSAPIYSRIWNETIIRVTSVTTVATDGMVTVSNQQGNQGIVYFKAPNTNQNDGHNHASSLYVVKPWNGDQTTTMIDAKNWIRDHK